MFCYLAIQYNIIKTKCIVDGCAYSDFAWKRGISVERSPRDTETNGCETGLCRPKRARVQWHCQEFSFGEAIASGRKSPSGVVQGALNISHSSPPDSWPVCFMVGRGLSDILWGLTPNPCFAPPLIAWRFFTIMFVNVGGCDRSGFVPALLLSRAVHILEPVISLIRFSFYSACMCVWVLNSTSAHKRSFSASFTVHAVEYRRRPI